MNQEFKTERVHFRMSPTVRRALERLAERQGVTMSDIVTLLVTRSAQRKGVWQEQSGVAQ